MCTCVCIFIKVYYISLILYFSRQVVYRINTIKSWFILIMLLHFKVCQGIRRHKNPILFHNQLLQFLFLFYFQIQLSQFLFLVTYFLTNLLLEYLITAKNPHFCSFVSFLIVLVTSFSKILESSRA